MPKITIVTPTVRPEGLALVAKALKRQTFKDFVWFISTPQWHDGADLYIPSEISNSPIRIEDFRDPEKSPGDVWALNKSYNKMIRYSVSPLILSWQDFTYAKPDILERFWTHYEQEPKTLVGAVGNKYADDSWTVMTWKDPRERDDQGPYYPCYFSDIEWNLAAIPKEAIYAVGGFDEEMDKKYGMDAYSVNDRINLLGGYDFKLDQTIKSYSLEHGRLNGSEWDKNNWNGEPYQEYRKKYLVNPKLPYLS